MRRLTQGLDTLNGMVAGLEERLRTSLREDTFTGFEDLAGRVTEVRDELRTKTHIVQEIQVLYHRSVDTLSVQIDQVSVISPLPLLNAVVLFSPVRL